MHAFEGVSKEVAHAYPAYELLLKFWDAATLAEYVRALTLLDFFNEEHWRSHTHVINRIQSLGLLFRRHARRAHIVRLFRFEHSGQTRTLIVAQSFSKDSGSRAKLHMLGMMLCPSVETLKPSGEIFDGERAVRNSAY